MKASILLPFVLVLLAAPFTLFSADKPDAAAIAKAVAPYVDETTLAVVHVDLSHVVTRPVADMLIRLVPQSKDEINAIQAEVTRRIAGIVRAGGKDIYLTVSMRGGQIPRVLAIVPLAAAADEKAVLAAMDIPSTAAQRVGEALVIRQPQDQGPCETHASPRPELTAAFESAGKGTLQAALILPAYTRRVVEELMPQLPKEVGGGPSSVLTRGVSWIAAGVDMSPHLALRVVIKSQDDRAAEALREKWVEVLRLAGQLKEIRTAVPNFEKLTSYITPRVQKDRLVLELDDKDVTINTIVAAVEVPLEKARIAARRTASMNNLKQIALAMHMYYDRQKHFPAAASCGPDGKPLLSWRVYILPYIEQDQLFRQFHLDEPWDSPNNKALIGKMPAIFRSPKSNSDSGKTHYLVPVGNGALYASNRDEPQFKDISDGTSNTIMAVEVDDEHAVTWTKPDDLAFDPNAPTKGIGNLYDEGFIAAYCDGSVRFLSKTINPKTLAALFTRAGGEVIEQY